MNDRPAGENRPAAPPDQTLVALRAKKRGGLPMVALLLALVGSGGCRGDRGEPAARSVLLISIDTLHVQSTGVFNPEVRGTPNLDALAREGVWFSHAYTRAPITLPAHTDLLSGAPSSRHGVMANGDAVPQEVTTLAEVFREAGYRTAAFVSLGVLGKRFGLDQGFDFYADPSQQEKGRWYLTADEVFPLVKEWLRSARGEPFFLWAHFSDPHEPYVPIDAPPDCELSLDGRPLGAFTLARKEEVLVSFELPPGRHRLRWRSLRPRTPEDRPETGLRLHLGVSEELSRWVPDTLPGSELAVDLQPEWDLVLANPTGRSVSIDLAFRGELVRPTPSDVLESYQREVEWVDEHLGLLREVVQSAGFEETLWIVVSDHGEGLFRHDRLGHAEYAFEDQLRVLWVMNGPGIPPGRPTPAPALLEDVAPTLLALEGLDAPPSMTGRSLVPCWAGGGCPEGEDWWAYGLDHERRELTAMAGYRWPYKWLWMRGEGRRGHDLLRDPWEERDLLRGGPRPESLGALRSAFPRARRHLDERLGEATRRLDREKNLDLLRSLGYVGTSPK